MYICIDIYKVSLVVNIWLIPSGKRLQNTMERSTICHGKTLTNYFDGHGFKFAECESHCQRESIRSGRSEEYPDQSTVVYSGLDMSEF